MVYFYLVSFFSLFDCVFCSLSGISVRLLRVIWLARILLISIVLFCLVLTILVLRTLKLAILLLLSLVCVVLVITVISWFLLCSSNFLRFLIWTSLTLSTLISHIHKVIWINTLELFLSLLLSINIVLRLIIPIRCWCLRFILLSFYFNSILDCLWL